MFEKVVNVNIQKWFQNKKKSYGPKLIIGSHLKNRENSAMLEKMNSVTAFVDTNHIKIENSMLLFYLVWDSMDICRGDMHWKKSAPDSPWKEKAELAWCWSNLVQQSPSGCLAESILLGNHHLY